MSPILLLSIALQIACCVHVVRSGRPLYWILILLMFSYIAVAIYVIAAVIPDMRHDPRARGGLRKVRRTLDPGRERRDAARRLDVADTPDNRRRLAEQHLQHGEYAEAAALYEGALRGLYRDDPDLMLGLARAQHGLGQPQQCRQTLEALIAANPAYRSHDGHLLYARALEDVGALDEALHEYESLAAGYPGEEGRVRHGLLLARLGRDDDARSAFEGALRHAAASPRHYQREQRDWIERARSELKAR
jgi:hypothetical protein